MIRKLKQLLTALLILSVIASAAPAEAFGFTDVSKAGIKWQGVKTNPVPVSSAADALCAYFRLRGMTLGRLYYTTPNGEMLDQHELALMTREVYPFLMSATSWYEYADAYPHELVYYIELFFHTPEYIEPSVKLAEEIAARIAGPELPYMQRLRAIYDYLYDNVDYDWDLYNSASPDTKSVGYTAYGALKNGVAVCEGYASAFALLCHAAGIPAYIVTGENKTGAHSWNLVYLFGSFYHVDVTGDDTFGERGRYFMVSEVEIKKTHTVDSSANRAAILSVHNAGLPSAQILCELGLMQGAGGGFDLDRSPSRHDAAVMLTRLIGKETQALQQKYPHPFTDVPEWASPYVGYLYRYGLTSGAEPGLYAGSRAAVINDYLTFTLRALGYSDLRGDFTWEKSIETAERLGLVVKGRYTLGAAMTRGDMAEISVRALTTSVAGGTVLLDTLVASGAVSSGRADSVRGYLPAP